MTPNMVAVQIAKTYSTKALAAAVNTLNSTISALTTTVAGKVAKGELVINVADSTYGAVADATYLDQRVSSGTFGISGAVPTDSNTFGKCYTNSNFTTAATDNTNAFRAAFDALLTSGQFAFTNRTILTGNRSLRKKLFIPAGSYYISDAAGLFSLLRQSPSGTQAGIIIEGDGKLNTILNIRITGSGSNDYMILDNNAFQNLTLKNLTIVCTTGNERIISHSSSGNAKRCLVENVVFKDYKDCLTILGTVNADRWGFYHSDFVTNIAAARLMVNAGNTQALSFDFYGANITHFQGGNVFEFGAGGQVRLWGGSGEIYGLNSNGAAGRLLYMTGSTLTSDQLEPTLSVNNFKMEIHDDAGVCDINDGLIVFRDSNILNLSNTRIANGLKEHVVARHFGCIQWFGGVFGDFKIATSTDPANDYTYGNRSNIVIRDAWVKNVNLLHTETSFYTTATDGLTTAFDTTATGGGVGIGRVQVERCKPWQQQISSGATPLVCVNGAPNHEMTWGSRPAVTHRVTHRGSNARGLGLMGSNVSPSVVIPPRCTIVRVGILKQTENVGVGGASRTWSLKDGNGTTLATLTALGTDTWSKAVNDIWRQVRSTNDRTLTFTCDTAATDNTGCEGYFFVEYI